MSTVYSVKDHELILDNQDKQYVLKLRDLPVEEKPREKLFRYGPAVLGTQELLAIILNTGTKKEEVLSMTHRILKDYGEKGVVSEKNPQKIAQDLDIPLTKACQIVACFELGQRFFKANNGNQKVIRTAKQAYDYLSDMRNLPKEHLRGLYLNNYYRVIHDEVISIGSLTANIIHPREVFKPALEYLASAVILAHNHPSGVVTPSDTDIKITNQLIEAGKILGVDLLDHIIITKNKFMSVPSNYT